MRIERRLGLVAAVLLVTAAGAGAQDLQAARELQLTAHLPKDPVMVWVGNVGNGAELYDDVVGLLRKVVPEEERAGFEEGLAEVDAKLGLKLRDDLLAYLGPEMAVAIDIPPVDSAAAAVMTEAPGSVATVLGKVGLWVQVRDRAKVDRALRTLSDRAGLVATEEGGLVRVQMAQEKSEGAEASGPEVAAFYGLSGNLLAVGFSADRVKAMLEPATAAERLAAGTDFKRVVAHLDRGAKSLAYVNLPRLQQLLRDSQMVQGALAAQEEAKGIAQVLLDPTMAPTGWGTTSVEVDGGVRQVSYGPSWTSGGAASLGIVAAVAVPNLLNATNRGREKRTMADIRTLATAAEAYAVDNEHYPSSDGVWVDAATLAGTLSPLYVKDLPATDGWNNPLRYWSDGSSYRIVSPGRGGQTSAEWSGQVEPERTTDFEADIVYGDGQFLVWPQRPGGD